MTTVLLNLNSKNNFFKPDIFLFQHLCQWRKMTITQTLVITGNALVSCIQLHHQGAGSAVQQQALASVLTRDVRVTGGDFSCHAPILALSFSLLIKTISDCNTDLLRELRHQSNVRTLDWSFWTWVPAPFVIQTPSCSEPWWQQRRASSWTPTLL